MTKITRTNILIPVEWSCTRNDHLHCGSYNNYFLKVKTTVNFFKGSNAKVKRLCTKERSYIYQKNIHVKYQSTSTHCLKFITCNKVQVSDRFTEWQKDGMKVWQAALNIDSCSILTKKNKLILQKFFRKYDKKKHFYLGKCMSKNIRKR